MAQSIADTTLIEKYKLSGEHGDGPELPLCTLIELLKEDSFYTTRDAALTRYRPSDTKGVRGPFEKTRDRLGYYLRKRKTEPDRLFRDGRLTEVIPDEEGEIRGTRAFRGATIKNLMKPRGKLRGKLGVRLLRSLYCRQPLDNGRAIENLMTRLNKCKVEQLDQIVQALENDVLPICDQAREIYHHIQNLNRTGLAQLLQEFGHQPFEPQLFQDGPPKNLAFATDEPVAIPVEPMPAPIMTDTPAPEIRETVAESIEVSEPTSRFIRFPKFSTRRKIFTLVALVALAFTAAQKVQFRRALDILESQGVGQAYRFVMHTTITVEDSHEDYRNLALIYIRVNRYKDAEQVLHELLSQENLSEKHYADCYLLLGQIKFATGNYQTALGMYHEAHRMYDNATRKNRSSLGLAKTHLAMGHLEEFEAWYNEAIYLDLKSKGQGNLAEMNHLAQLNHMLARDYEAALDAALTEWARVQETEEEDQKSEARSNLAMAYAFAGQITQAQDHALQATEAAFRMGDQEKQVYNLITQIVINRQLQIPVSQYALNQIDNRIKSHNDNLLKMIKELALEL